MRRTLGLVLAAFLVGGPVGACGQAASNGSGGSGEPVNDASTGSSSSGSGAGSGSSSGGGSGAGSGSTSSGSGSATSSGSTSSGSSGGDDGGSGSSSGGGDDGGNAADAPVLVGVDGGECGGTVYSAGVTCAGGVPSTGTNPCTIITGTHASACAPCTTCPPDHTKCCVEQAGSTTGYDVGGLLLGGKDTVTFTGVYAPADGDYDVVWYYFCGNSDTDNNYPASCPGSKEGSTVGPPGCRQALFSVNGVDDPTVYEVPCFLTGTNDGQWTTIHSWVRDDPSSKVLVPFHLKQGSNNTIKIYAGTHDTVDLSGIRVPDGR